MKLNFRIQDEKEVAALLARKGLKAPVVYDVDDDDEDYNEPESSWEGDDAVEERDGLIRQREIAEIRVAFRNGLHSVARGLTKRGLSPEEVKQWFSEPFTEIFPDQDLHNAVNKARRWVQKRQKTE